MLQFSHKNKQLQINPIQPTPEPICGITRSFPKKHKPGTKSLSFHLSQYFKNTFSKVLELLDGYLISPQQTAPVPPVIAASQSRQFSGQANQTSVRTLAHSKGEKATDQRGQELGVHLTGPPTLPWRHWDKLGPLGSVSQKGGKVFPFCRPPPLQAPGEDANGAGEVSPTSM